MANQPENPSEVPNEIYFGDLIAEENAKLHADSKAALLSHFKLSPDEDKIQACHFSTNPSAPQTCRDQKLTLAKARSVKEKETACEELQERKMDHIKDREGKKKLGVKRRAERKEKMENRMVK